MSKLIYILSIILSLSFFSSCADNDEKEYVVLTSLEINPVDKDLYIGDKYQLKTSHQPADIKLPELTWKSSDTKVATVSSSGEVVAIADGVATITVSYGSLSDSKTIVISKIQSYTSFVVTIDTSNKLVNCVAGYYTQDGLCKKLGDLGELTRGVYSPEIKINIDTLTRIYVFTNTTKPLRFERPYLLTKNIKNIFLVDINNSGISITEWPE